MDKALIQRIRQILNKECASEKEFAIKIGSSPSTLNQHLNGKREISLEVIRKILSSFENISPEWLLTGNGEMFKSPVPKSAGSSIDNIEDYNIAKEKGLQLLPEVDFKFAAGQTQLINGAENITRYWYLPDCKDCEGVAEVVGNSMSPTLPPGCFVALKRQSFNPYCPNQIPFGNIFGVVIEDMETNEYHGYIKILHRYKDSDMEKKYWIAHSINPEFDDFDIDISKVRSLWLVKQHIVNDILS